MGLFAGLLGWDPTDERLPGSPEALREAGIAVTIIHAHPGGASKHLQDDRSNSREKHSLTAISTGGGIIEVIEIDGVKVSIDGDYYETLLYVGSRRDSAFALESDPPGG